MKPGYKVCKICGKEYEYCMTNRRDTIFRWQDVACCPEHGATYFQQIAESRGEARPVQAVDEVCQGDEDFDELFEEDSEDDELFEEDFEDDEDDEGEEELTTEK